MAFILERLLHPSPSADRWALVAFSLVPLCRGDLNAHGGQDTTMERGDELRTKLGLNDSARSSCRSFHLPMRSRGNFGLSYRTSSRSVRP